MSLDVIIRRNISFVGCILIIVATELSKISRSLFIALQWRRRFRRQFRRQFRLIHTLCIFVGLLELFGLLYHHCSIFRSCELIRYLAIAVMRWFPLMCEIYDSAQKHFLLMHMCAAYTSCEYLFSTAV